MSKPYEQNQVASCEGKCSAVLLKRPYVHVLHVSKEIPSAVPLLPVHFFLGKISGTVGIELLRSKTWVNLNRTPFQSPLDELNLTADNF